MKPILASLAAVSMAACAQLAPPTGSPVMVKVKPSAAAKVTVTGYSMPVVRTYRTDAPPEEGLISDTFAALAEKTEVKGVHCVADSRDLHVEFTSPAMLVVPKLKGEPPAIHVSCSGRGVGSEFQIVPSLDGAGMGTAIGPVALVTTAVASGVAISRDEWTYGDTEQVVWIPVWPQN